MEKKILMPLCFLLIFFGVCISSCNAQIAPQTIVLEPDSSGKSPCEIWLDDKQNSLMPGWDGVYIGQDAAQAKSNLENQSLVNSIEMDDWIEMSKGELTWEWNWEKGDYQWAGRGRAFYYIDPISSDKRIEDMYISFPCAITLAEVIKAFGEPEYARVNIIHYSELPPPNVIISSYSFYWIQLGFLVKGIPAQGSTRIDEEVQITDVEFFRPTWKGFNPSGYKIDVIPWHGYDDQQNYMAP